jgi:hypothetical protein
MKLYRHMLTEEWLMDYTMKYQLGGPDHPMDASSKVLNMIIPAAGLTKAFSIKWDRNLPLCQALALAVGHKKQTGEVKIAPKERINRVKEVLGENIESSWYKMS